MLNNACESQIEIDDCSRLSSWERFETCSFTAPCLRDRGPSQAHWVGGRQIGRKGASASGLVGQSSMHLIPHFSVLQQALPTATAGASLSKPSRWFLSSRTRTFHSHSYCTARINIHRPPKTYATFQLNAYAKSRVRHISRSIQPLIACRRDKAEGRRTAIWTADRQLLPRYRPPEKHREPSRPTRISNV